MKLRTIPLAALAATAILGWTTHSQAAAVVTYSYYTATGLADTSWMNVTGYDHIVAGDVGSSSNNSWGGVSWQAMPIGSNTYTVGTNGVSLFYSAPGVSWADNLDTGLYLGADSVLDTGGWTGLQNSGVDYTLDLTGLTIGKDYKVQFVMADNRFNNTRYATILAKSGVTGDSAPTNFDYFGTPSSYLVITASFTADADKVSFQPGTKWGSPAAPDGTALNAVQVLAVPEPGAALLGGLGMLALLRRRR